MGIMQRSGDYSSGGSKPPPYGNFITNVIYSFVGHDAHIVPVVDGGRILSAISNMKSLWTR